MKISIIDASNYFKGLLLLIRKDNKITEPEIKLIKQIGKKLGFEKEFCEGAINEIINNEYIVDTPSLFSNKDIAEKFIKDGFSIALSDNEIHAAEEEWLKSTAEKNNIDFEWFIREKANILMKKNLLDHLEVEDLVIEYPNNTNKQ
jgi:hypothetical protein